MNEISKLMKIILVTFSIIAIALLAGCGGGGGSGGGSAGWYYHWNCNGDPQCLATNPGALNQASGTVGPESGGQTGCNLLMTFGTQFWGIPPATQSCDNSPTVTTPPPAPAPAPTITGFTPASGSPGVAVTITGTNFVANSTVNINGVSAPVTSISGTQIVITIPYMANFSGPFIVTTSGGTVSSSTSFSVINAFNGVAGTGTLYVAVGGNGSIITSTSGVTWATQISGTTTALNAVTWSGSQFAVVGANGIILTSPNGSTWTQQTSGVTANLNGITWDSTHSQFVAVGANGIILTSPTGVTWTPRNSGTLYALNAVTWAGTQFVTAGANYTLLTSPNGVTWTIVYPHSCSSSPSYCNFHGVIWTGSQLVAVGDYGVLLTSPNGTAWTQQFVGGTAGTANGGIPDNISGVAWSGSQYAIAVLGGFWYSPDGVTWSPSASGSSNTLHGITYSGGQYVAVGASATIFTSTNGITWTQR